MLFGGYAEQAGSCGVPGSRLCGDTWEWDGEAWHRLAVEPAPPARFEDDDARKRATPLEPGQVYGALRITAGDQDWYSVDICGEGTLTLDVLFPTAAGDLELLAYGPTGRLVGFGASATDDEHLRIRATRGVARILLVVLGADADIENGYVLALAQEGCGPGGPAPEDDLFEDNDDLPASHLLQLGSYAGLALLPGDEDWFAIDICDGGLLTVRISFRHEAGDLQLGAYGAAGGAPVAVSASADDDEELRLRAHGDVRAYLRVSGAGNAYDLFALLVECE